MRNLFLAFAILLFTTVPAMAIDSRPCPPGVGLVARATDGGVSVRWEQEPKKTAKRVVMAVRADGKVVTVESKGPRKRLELERGEYTIVVAFYDAAGEVICTRCNHRDGRSVGAAARSPSRRARRAGQGAAGRRRLWAADRGVRRQRLQRQGRHRRHRAQRRRHPVL